MNILALETATEICSVALLENGVVRGVVEDRVPRQHAEKLPLFYQELAAKTELDLSKLDGIALSIGPGSFTGLRIGLSFAKGLAYGHNLPLIPVPTLLAIAAGTATKSDSLKMVLYSHRDKVFYQDFLSRDNRLVGVEEPQAAVWGDITSSFKSETQLIHWGCESLLAGTDIEGEAGIPSSVQVGKLAEANFREWLKERPFELVPDYISPFEIGK